MRGLNPRPVNPVHQYKYMEKENTGKYKDVKQQGGVYDTQLCIKCGGAIISNEVEICGAFFEIGSFCYNSECERFQILIV